MEEPVATAIVVPWAVHRQDFAIVVHVPGVKELVEVVARLAAALDVRADVVEGAEAAGESDVLGVGEVGGAEDEDAVGGDGVEDFGELVG